MHLRSDELWLFLFFAEIHQLHQRFTDECVIDSWKKARSAMDIACLHDPFVEGTHGGNTSDDLLAVQVVSSYRVSRVDHQRGGV